MWSLLNSVEHFEVDLLLWDDGGVLIQQNAFKFSFPEYKIRQNNFFKCVIPGLFSIVFSLQLLLDR